VAAAAAGAATLFVAGAAQIGPPLAAVAVDLLLVVGGVLAVGRWSSRVGWSARHRLALAGGTLMSHVAFAVLQRSIVEIPLWLDLLGGCGRRAQILAGWSATAPLPPTEQEPL